MVQRLFVVFALVLAGCSGDLALEGDAALEDDAALESDAALEDTTSTLSVSTTGPGQSSTGRADRVQVAVLFGDTVWESDGGTDLVAVRPVTSEVLDVAWVGADRNLATLENGRLELWHPEFGSIATAECAGCHSLADDGETVFGITADGALLGFDGDDLSIATTVLAELPVADARVLVATPVAVVGDEVAVIIPDPQGTANSGGPEQVWMVDVTNGDARRVVADDGNVASSSHAANGSQMLVGGWGVQSSSGGSAFCGLFSGVWLVDLDAGTTEDLGEIVPGDWARSIGGALVVVDDVFWNGDVPYAAVSVFFDDGGGDNCRATVPQALYRFVGGRWQLVDAGPLGGVRPVGPAAGDKVVVLGDGRGFVEIDARPNLIGPNTRILGSTTPASEISLVPPVGSIIDPAAVVAPFNDLAGVELGTTGAAADLSAVFGDPTADTGWNVGCPLDANDDLDERAVYEERMVAWGSLRVHLGRTGSDGPGELVAWSYSLPESAGGPGPDELAFPAGMSFGDDLAAAAERTELAVQADPLTQADAVSIDGMTIYANGSGAISEVWVPGPLRCE